MPKVDIQLDIGENYYEPTEFVDAAAYAEELGFRTAWLGDHFVPWFHSGRRSAFVWSVLGIALERTSKIKLGPLVTTPIGARYHPAIIAQASATLNNMYPGRLLLGVGTGEALNERPFWHDRWPEWEERIARLTEGITLIKRLWKTKDPFSFNGKFFPSKFYHLYTKPKNKIPIYFSAIGRRAAYYAGLHADNLVTISPRNTIEKLQREILPEFERGCREAGKRRGGIVIHMDFSLDTPSALVKNSWRTLGWMLKDSWSIENPVAVEKAGRKVGIEDVKKAVHFCKSWRAVMKIIDDYIAVGANAIVLITEADKKKIRDVAHNVLNVL
ncbi:MAG: LLM class flavin-dependent oxidoreductase [Thaumarchaeota archaeon]|nr:LLM class flavin-dependent oxidoreductase [Nitrososphaerota archaeon]